MKTKNTEPDERARTGSLSVRVVETLDDLEGLADAWSSLLAASERDVLPLTHGWTVDWWRSFATPSSRLHVVVVSDADRIVAIAPFMRTRTTFRWAPITKMSLMANGYSPGSDIIVRRGADVGAIAVSVVQHLLKQPRVHLIEFTKVDNTNDRFQPFMDALGAVPVRVGVQPDIESPYIDVSRDWDTIVRDLPRSFRKQVRRRFRAVSASDGLTVERIVIDTPDHPVFDDMLRVSAGSWKREVHTHLGGEPGAEAFLRALSARFGPGGAATVWELTNDNQPVAFEFHVVYNGTAYPLRADYREDAADVSPGATLEAHIMQHLSEDPHVTEYNTCGHTYAYLLRWTDRTRGHVTIQAFPARVLPRSLYAYEYRWRPRLRPVATRLRSVTGWRQTRPPRTSHSRRADMADAPAPSVPTPRAGLTVRAARYGRAVLDDVTAVWKRQRAFRRVEPHVATLFLTYRCNSHCSTCTLWRRSATDEKQREIGFAEWRVIIDKLKAAGVTSVEVFGGNVLLRKDLLVQVLHYLRDTGFSIHLPTNQLGLDDTVGQAIVDCVDYVYISTDGLGEDQDAIRGLTGSGERAEQAIARLRRLRRTDAPPPVLVCNTTVSKYNCDALEPLVPYALDHGFDEIHFEYAGEHTQQHIANSLVDGLRPTPYYVQQGDESILVDPDGARRLKRALRRIRHDHATAPIKISTINIDSLSQRHLHRGTIPHRRCYVERLEVTVDPAGDLVACPFIHNYVMGNLVSDDFGEVWNNDRHHRFRELQNGGHLEMCEHCILGVQRNPGVLTSLRRVYQKRVSDLRYRLPRRRAETSAPV